ncbi:hypothetical protein [Kitasatospora sp. NPDC059673]|uniref:hypothetical protein n=1 Tax=Kitasatospora sp. NPDC059673 TaxID=3346901 RepID=UPI0036885F09
METLTVQAPQDFTFTAEEEFDLVIGDLEQGVPEHRQTRMESVPTATCSRIYCCF